MLIDWFTVGAQVINFLILVWLLKRFLYHPILDAIDAREKGIAVRLADAQAKETEATREREAFQRKNADFDAARAALLSDATAAAATERQRLLDAAREAATALGAKRQERLLRDAQALQQEIGQRMQQEVFALARKVLADLAGAPLEAQMVSVFTERLAALGGDDKDTLQRALQARARSRLWCAPVSCCLRWRKSAWKQRSGLCSGPARQSVSISRPILSVASN